jgi:hypothetical protein
MLRSLNDLHGFAVEGTDGRIGRVEDFYFDDLAWTVRFLVVATGDWLDGRKVLISPIAIGDPDATGRVLPAAITREQVRRSPDIDTRKPVSRQHEVEQYGGFKPPEITQQERAFVEAQAESHRQRGDDPHLRSGRAVVRYHIHATDGDIGHVDGLIVDDETWAIRYLVVNTSDWWLGHQVLIAPQWIADISWLEATVSVDLTRQAVKHAPAYDPDALPDREQERRVYEHYDRTAYWGGEMREAEVSHR